MGNKKKVEWTDEDQQMLERLQKKKRLYEESQRIDLVADHLFKIAKFIKKANNEHDLEGLKYTINTHTTGYNHSFLGEEISSISYEVEVPAKMHERIFNDSNI